MGWAEVSLLRLIKVGDLVWVLAEVLATSSGKIEQSSVYGEVCFGIMIVSVSFPPCFEYSVSFLLSVFIFSTFNSRPLNFLK